MKKLKNNKNGSFNTLISGEIESITWKVNKAWEKYVKKPFIRGEKPFIRDEKSRVSKGRMSLTL